MLTERDIRYIRAQFVPLDAVCREGGRAPEEVRALMADRRLPGPAYVLPDGTEMVPHDYFDYPDRDRVAFGRPPTRDELIAEPRRRYPELWARSALER